MLTAMAVVVAQAQPTKATLHFVLGPAVGCGVLWVVSWLAGFGNPFKLAVGADGRLSTSKMQWLLWTFVGMTAYSTVLILRIIERSDSVALAIPKSLLVVLGLSTVTMAGAKAITSHYASTGQVAKDSPATKDETQQGVLKDDDGRADLSKVQLMSFTFLAIGAYLYRFFVLHRGQELIDIDDSLMVLMGLSQGGYLGKKLVTTDAPRLITLQPASASPGAEVVLKGDNLAGPDSVVLFDGKPIGGRPDGTDSEIHFKVPEFAPNGSVWQDGQQVSITVLAGGRETANSVPFAVISRARDKQSWLG